MQQISISQAIQLAIEHHAAGRLDQAQTIYSEILAQMPQCADALHLAGVLASQRGKFDVAIAMIKQAIAIGPATAEYHYNLATVYRNTGKILESLEHARAAVALKPNWYNAHAVLGPTLSELGMFEEAKPALQRAIDLDPSQGGAYLDMANIFWKQCRHEEALAWIRRAVAREPGYAGHHWSLARILLQLGQMKEGWEEFEWRLKWAQMRLDRGFSQPQWDGSPPNGRTILLHTEGGLGDAINFIRLVPMVAKGGGRFVLECQPGLTALFAGTKGIDEIVARGQTLPAFDCHIALQGLPRILNITLENIPNQVPYLSVPRDRADKFAGRIVRDGKRRVGLVWCGVMYNEADFRTRTLDHFFPLMQLPGVRFFSLQKGEASAQKPPPGVDWVDFSAELKDFADTAALVDQLDLVISVDTSTAHLAGALAKPVWVLIPTQSDFRWLLDRTDSPWYPTMRLFRQPLGEDWSKPFAELKESLAQYLHTA